MIGTTVFVKGYSASVRMHVEMPNAPSFCSNLLVPPAIYSEPQSLKSLVMNSCKKKPRHQKLAWPKPITRLFTTTDSWSIIKPVEVIPTNGTCNIFSCPSLESIMIKLCVEISLIFQVLVSFVSCAYVLYIPRIMNLFQNIYSTQHQTTKATSIICNNRGILLHILNNEL